eukprot:gnl/TRDRNA2_/TRDRNA2_174307_c0_seq12.p3 gnl/TRDRNA2_/TRDRNA2_174307_c0~~gnl/TRDRNA2_/TRDRNA2_174307_c0_seq12.p3  ORF type:complete len:123 (+),score=4.38 gnl/TRDRNA2_/TRDRNA2_174307_c0_seq12:471-839(+)
MIWEHSWTRSRRKSSDTGCLMHICSITFSKISLTQRLMATYVAGARFRTWLIPMSPDLQLSRRLRYIAEDQLKMTCQPNGNLDSGITRSRSVSDFLAASEKPAHGLGKYDVQVTEHMCELGC